MRSSILLLFLCAVSPGAGPIPGALATGGYENALQDIILLGGVPDQIKTNE